MQTLVEELHGFVGCQVFQDSCGRVAESTHFEQPLCLQVEALAGGDEHHHTRCLLQDLADQPGTFNQVLEVIQHQHQLFILQVVKQLSFYVASLSLLETECLEDGRQDELDGANGCKLDETGSLGERF